MANITPEDEIQSAVNKMLDKAGIRYIHINKAVYMHKRGGSLLKSIPDIIEFDERDRYDIALLLELKKIGGALEPGQIEWHSGNVNVIVTHGMDQAVAIVQDFISFHKRKGRFVMIKWFMCEFYGIPRDDFDYVYAEMRSIRDTVNYCLTCQGFAREPKKELKRTVFEHIVK